MSLEEGSAKATGGQEGSDFDERWNQFRQSLLLPAVRKAAQIFQRTLGAGEATVSNGAVILNAGKGSGAHSLTFTPDREKRVVVSSVSLERDKDESIPLDRLDENLVEEKMKQFVSAIARNAQESRPQA